MKSYLGLVSEYARAHKKKNRLTVICIAISVMLVVAVFSMAEMSVQAQISENIRQKGNWHAVFTGISDETAAQIDSRSDVGVSGWVGMAEDSVLNGRELFIQGGEADISGEMGLQIIEGAYPQSEREAALDRAAMEQFGLSTGDRVEISVGGGEAQYTVTGIYNDFSSLQGRDAHGLFLSAEGIRALPAGYYQEYYYVQFGGGVKIDRAIAEIRAEHGLSDGQVSVNQMLLGLMGQSDDSSMRQLYLTAAIIAVLIAMAGIFMISGSFNMNVLERTQFFGLMRCLGATNRQVKRYVRMEGLRYSMTGIPVGLAAGCVVTWAAALFLNMLDSQYLPEMPLLRVSPLALLAGAAIGFLTILLASRSPAKRAARVPPQAAVTGNISYKNNAAPRRASNTGLLRVDSAMGLSHAFSNKKSMALITGSFALSIVLFLSFTVFIAFMNHALRPLQPYAPDISVVGADDSVLIDKALAEQIKALPGADKVYARMFCHDIPASAPQGGGAVTLISYDDPQFEWAGETLVSGDIGGVRDGGGVFIAYSEDMGWQAGDTITLEISGAAVDVPVAGILSDTPFVSDGGAWPVICSEATFTALTGVSGYTIIDMQVSEDISNQVRSLLSPELRMLDRQQSNREVRATYNAMAVFVYGFLTVIALVALINILNTISASVSNRMNNYGVMRAVGMSGKQLRKMIAAEAAAYAITGCIAGGILGLLLHRFFFEILITSNWGEAWQPPLAVLAVVILAALVTAFIAVISPAKRIEKMSIANVISA